MADLNYFVRVGSGGGGGQTRHSSTGVYWALGFDGGTGSDPTGITVYKSGDHAGVYGTVELVVLKSGSWGVDAAGYMILSSKNGTWANNDVIEETDTTKVADAYVVTNEAWGPNEDAAAFASLNACEAAIGAHTDNATHDGYVWCSRGTGVDTTNVVFQSLSSNFDNLYIKGDDGTASGVTAYANDGKYTGSAGWSDLHYDLTYSGASGVSTLHCQNGWATNGTAFVDGLQIGFEGSATTNYAPLSFYNATPYSPGGAKNCRLYVGGNGVNGIYHNGGSTVEDTNNIIMYDGANAGSFNCGIYLNANKASTTHKLYNNFVDGNSESGGDSVPYGIWLASAVPSSATVEVRNNAVRNCSTTDIYDTTASATVTMENNRWDDTTSGTNVQVTDWTKVCVDPDNATHEGKDYTPTTSTLSYALFMSAEDTGLPTTDIRGTSRGTGGTTDNGDIGPIHVDQPIFYVNTDNPGDNDGRNNANGKSTLGLAEAALQHDLTDYGRTSLTIYCAGTTADGQTTFSGYTTGASNTITISGDDVSAGVTDGVNTTGTFSTSYYHISTGSLANHALTLNDDYITAKKIQVRGTHTSGAASCVSLANANNVLEYSYVERAGTACYHGVSLGNAGTVRNCVIRGSNGTQTSADGIVQWSPGGAVIVNNTIHGFNTTGSYGIDAAATVTSLYNNLFYDCTAHLNGSFTNYGGNWGNTAETEIDLGASGESNADTELAKFVVNPGTDFTPVYSSGVNAVYANGTLNAGMTGATEPLFDILGNSRDDGAGGTTTQNDIGAIHLASPVAYVDNGATGVADGRNNTNAYTSVTTAESSVQTDCVANNRNPTIYCAGTVTHSGDQHFEGYTTDSTHLLTLAADPGQSDGENTGVTFDTNKFYIDFTATATAHSCLNFRDMDANITGIQVRASNSGANSPSCFETSSSSGSQTFNVTFDKCRIESNGATANVRGFIGACSSGVTLNMIVKNCTVKGIFYGGASYSAGGTFTLNMDNCVIDGDDFTSSVGAIGWGDTLLVDNSVIIDVAAVKSGTATLNYCATETGTGSNPQTVSANDGVDMNSPSTGDYRPITGGVLDDNGSAAPSGTDLIGTLWGLAQIGAFNDEVAAGGGLGIPIAMYHYLNNVGSRL